MTTKTIMMAMMLLVILMMMTTTTTTTTTTMMMIKTIKFKFNSQSSLGWRNKWLIIHAQIDNYNRYINGMFRRVPEFSPSDIGLASE